MKTHERRQPYNSFYIFRKQDKLQHLVTQAAQSRFHSPPFSTKRSSFHNFHFFFVSRDSSVGITTRYGLDGPGIESRWEVRFSAPVSTDPGTHPASCTMGTRSFPGVKRPVRGVYSSPPSSAEVKERVQLYLYSPSGPSWPVPGLILTFFFSSKNTFFFRKI